MKCVKQWKIEVGSRVLSVLCKVSLLTLMLSACADNLSGDVYTREEARKSMQVRYGWVESTRPVAIEGERGFVGQAGGGVIGGVAGSTIGHGAGQALGTAVGAVAGAVAGGAAQERMTRAQGAEIIVRLDGGETMAVVQEVESINQFRAGQRVRIMRGNDGSSRVTAVQAH
jgi:outer membrane lipoprotein SlyB